jgi:hypothetical protein
VLAGKKLYLIEGKPIRVKREQHEEDHRRMSKQAVDKLVVQFRIERAARRVGWFAAATFAIQLILALPWVSRPIVKIVSSFGL